MLLDLRGKGRWYALTPSAGRWWAHLAAGSAAEDTAAVLARLYTMPLEQIRADGGILIDDLLGCGLLERTDSTGARLLRRWRQR